MNFTFSVNLSKKNKIFKKIMWDWFMWSGVKWVENVKKLKGGGGVVLKIKKKFVMRGGT